MTKKVTNREVTCAARTRAVVKISGPTNLVGLKEEEYRPIGPAP